MGGRMGHSSRMGKADTAPAGQVFELTDMDVEEVSLVDRAANKKKFLVVKRDGGEMPTEVQPNGKGGFSTTANGTTKAGEPGVPPGKKPKAPPAAGAMGKAGGMEVPPGFKEAVTPLIDKATEALSTLSDAVGSSKPADMGDDGEMPGVPADFINGITAVMNMLDRAQNMWPAAAPDPEDDPTQGGDGGSDEAEEGPTAMTMRLALDNLGKAFARKRLDKALVQKIGAKMSKDRFTRLQQAVAQLANLVNEVAGQPATAPAGTPPVGKSGTATTKNAPPVNPIAQISAQLSELTGSVKTLSDIVVKDHQKLETIAKSRKGPSSGPVETTDETNSTGDDDFSWPLDMAEPVTRETVDKSLFFTDEE